MAWVVSYMGRGYGSGAAIPMIIIGIILFCLVWVQLLLLALDVTSTQHNNWWWVIFALTTATAMSTFVDYFLIGKSATPITAVTVFAGSLATLFSVGIWSTAPNDPGPIAVVITQAAANAVQLGAIFNLPREEIKTKDGYVKVAPKGF